MSENVPAPTPENKPAAAPEVKKESNEPLFDVKVDGKVVKVPQSQLIAGYQKGAHAETVLNKNQEALKGLAGLQQLLSTEDGIVNVISQVSKSQKISPKAVLQKLYNSGLISKDDAIDVSANYIDEHMIKPSKLTKEQLAAQQQAKELERYRKQEADAKKKYEDQQKAQQNQMVYEGLRKDVGRALEADKSLPQTPELVRVALTKIRVALQAGKIKDADVPKFIPAALKLAAKEYKVRQAALWDTLDDEALIAELGEERSQKISKILARRASKVEKEKEKAKDKKEQGKRSPRNPRELEEWKEAKEAGREWIPKDRK